ncbi:MULTISPECIES: aldo/keto reductase [unclassified Arcicella]|uniref:aldo/keto reductase n=1 Tax=unclassified Arcicella TaxID=2644986 RepID=UPI002856D6AF|nr:MULTISPECIES: aldo/keto reductase [unclassified Arcicella]MDR6562874.1 aryl-alcohol dehydrogenase-like predicted oxidoreductase [Arcicella sp. BE51]MDR6812785.1 aryl-alcohol dehydrogenase-like predicted oxidoreductase [Arcicella sp. BE140]MDR6824097.1 aryl-alcohol dehydrogenase-like predicted oxidoreductase [Arcicella sp. BE139]
MEYRQLGASGLEVPVLSFGTATFGGGNDFFKAWGSTQVEEATRLVDICLEAGLNFFDTADVYSQGLSEEILGKALAGKRDKSLISTKATFTFGDGPNNQGSSRYRLIKQVEGSLKRLNTDYIDLYHMHGFDGNTPIEETLRALDDLIQSGKIRYIAASNFSGWHLMKSQAIADKYGWNKYVAHQVYYSLANREYEWELMPLGLDQKVGGIIWSPLAAGRLGGKYRRNQPLPQDSRVAQGGSPIPEAVINEEVFYNIIDALDEVAEETGKTLAQVAINWVLQRPTVSSIIIGARNEAQLLQNIEAVGWNLTTDQVKKLDQASEVPTIYPYWHQRQNLKLNPLPKFY